jgi:diacylglycerol kinase family enzyme
MLPENEVLARPAIDPSRPRRFIALVNARAGEVLQSGREAFAEAIVKGFEPCGVVCDVRFVSPRRLARAVGTAIAEKPDALLVAGGDGTINRLLDDLQKADIPVGLLPLGTLNLLARDVGLEGGLAAILPRLAQLDVRHIDLASVNEHLFHSNAGLGFFARMAREREEARHRIPSSKKLGFVLAALRSIWLHRPVTIDITVDGVVETYEADALLVTNNHFDGSEWRRGALDAGMLELHMLQAAGFVARLRAAAAVYRGTWRALPHLRSVTASSVTVRRRGRSRSTIALDGEIYRVGNPIRFSSKPAALELITGLDPS